MQYNYITKDGLRTGSGNNGTALVLLGRISRFHGAKVLKPMVFKINQKTCWNNMIIGLILVYNKYEITHIHFIVPQLVQVNFLLDYETKWRKSYTAEFI